MFNLGSKVTLNVDSNVHGLTSGATKEGQRRNEPSTLILPSLPLSAEM